MTKFLKFLIIFLWGKKTFAAIVDHSLFTSSRLAVCLSVCLSVIVHSLQRAQIPRDSARYFLFSPALFSNFVFHLNSLFHISTLPKVSLYLKSGSSARKSKPYPWQVSSFRTIYRIFFDRLLWNHRWKNQSEISKQHVIGEGGILLPICHLRRQTDVESLNHSPSLLNEFKYIS